MPITKSVVTTSMTERQEHWDSTYAERGEDQVSWYETDPTFSLEMLDALRVTAGHSVLDVGGGASRLVDRLLTRGFVDLAVLDISPQALELAQRRLGHLAAAVKWWPVELLSWQPPRRFDVWHDRAVFHFLVDPDEQERYRWCLQAAVRPGGHVVVGTFAHDGPDHCSGLPVARYSPEQLVEALGADQLRVVKTRREVHRTPGGAAQPFTWVGLQRASAAVDPSRSAAHDV